MFPNIQICNRKSTEREKFMDSSENYGIIIRHLRKRSGLSVQKTAKLLGKSAGWICEIENGVGTCRLRPTEFDRAVELLGGSKERHMFKTWIAGLKNQERASKVFDGAVLKFIRIKKGLSLTAAAQKVGISKGYLSKLETGLAAIRLERRNELMHAYGYSPSSFKNLSTDPVRSKAVPNSYKFEILRHQMTDAQAEEFFQPVIQSFLQAKST